MASIGRIQITTRDITKDLSLVVRLPRSFTLRTRLACWLIGLAGRVIDVPCEVEMRSRSVSPDAFPTVGDLDHNE